MKTLKKIKLNGLNDAELRDREMDALNGGDGTWEKVQRSPSTKKG